MRLLVITQVVDAEDPILAATVPKLKALASRCDQLVVLAGRVGAHDLPADSTIRSFGAPDTFRRGLRFVKALAPYLLGRRVDAVLAHMSPIYLVLAAPLAKPMRLPLLLWYTHPTASRTLRLASKLASARTTATPTSFPLPASAEAIGHGIDVEAFPCRGQNGDGAVLDVLALGRYSSVKGYETVLRAVHRAAEAGIGAPVDDPRTDAERRRAPAAGVARAPAQRAGPAGVGDLREALPPAERASGWRADVLVSNTVRGSADKAVLEPRERGRRCIDVARAPPDGSASTRTTRRRSRNGWASSPGWARSGAPSSAAACGKPSSSATPRPPGQTRSCASLAKRQPSLRFLRRNVVLVYAVYAVTIVSGLLLTPIVVGALGTEQYGVWAVIGSVLAFIGLLDLGIGPSVIRFSAEQRGRKRPEETSALASTALGLYSSSSSSRSRSRSRLRGCCRPSSTSPIAMSTRRSSR